MFFVVDKSKSEPDIAPLFLVLQRATRHCPWSGTLWSQYLLSLEREDQPFYEIEEVKHKATSTGLMDVGGMEEVLKVHTAWCGYLNRRAFQDGATDEEADVAEVGIRSALESVRELGERKYGESYKGDPTYRLEQIYVEYLSHSGLWDRARREVWQILVPARGHSYEFWMRWYQWEMLYWSRVSANSRTNGASSSKRLFTASEATAVLRSALRRKNLDWPEKILEVFLQHVEDHENVEELQAAVILVRRIGTALTKRREKERVEALALQQQQYEQDAPLAREKDGSVGAKRKRDPDVDADANDADAVNKKPRASGPPGHAGHAGKDEREPTDVTSPRRDRENTSIIVRNLPPDTTEVKLRQYFRDVSAPFSLVTKAHSIALSVGPSTV